MNTATPDKPDSDSGAKPLGNSQQLDAELYRELLRLEAEREARQTNNILWRMFRGVGSEKPTRGNAL